MDFLLDVNPSERTPPCFYWPLLPLPLFLQVKYWTQTCATTSVCSFRRARWTTSSSRSYGTTSTYAPSPVSTTQHCIHYCSALSLHSKAPAICRQTRNVQHNLVSVHICLHLRHLNGNNEHVLYASHSWNPLEAALLCSLSITLHRTVYTHHVHTPARIFILSQLPVTHSAKHTHFNVTIATQPRTSL